MESGGGDPEEWGGEEDLRREQWWGGVGGGKGFGRGKGGINQRVGGGGLGEGSGRGQPAREMGEGSWWAEEDSLGKNRGGELGMGSWARGALADVFFQRPLPRDGSHEAGAKREVGGEQWRWCAAAKSRRKGSQCLARCLSVCLRD